MWTIKAVTCHQLWGPGGLLSHALHPDDLDLKVTGQHSEGGLKHLEKLYLRRVHISPSLRARAPPEKDRPRKEVPVFVPDPCPTASRLPP